MLTLGTDYQLYRVVSADEDMSAPVYTDKEAGISAAGYRWMDLLIVVLNTDTPPPNPKDWPAAGVAPVFANTTTDAHMLVWCEELGRYVHALSSFGPTRYVVDVMGQRVAMVFPTVGVPAGQSCAVFVAGYGNSDPL